MGDGLTREAILERLAERLRPRADVLALWEAGSTAFGRTDEWSDLDLATVVEDGAGDAVFAAVEEALSSLSPIDLVWRVPEPAWHGASQRFYRLTDAAPTLFVDLEVLARSNTKRSLEPEQHGHAVVLFDKGDFSVPPPFDEAALRARMKADLADVIAKFEMMQCLVDKELRRGNAIEAFAFYWAMTLRPLVTVLGMQHRPLRYDFGLRYVGRDFPPDVARTIETLVVVADTSALADLLPGARALFRQTVADLSIDALPLAALSAEARRR